MTSQMGWTTKFEQTFSGGVGRARTGLAGGVRSGVPRRVDPFSYISVTELHRFADEVQMAAGECLLGIAAVGAGQAFGWPRRLAPGSSA